jgi:hypothetical protein
MSLIPSASIEYETVNGITYAVQEGLKTEIGYQFDSRTSDGRPVIDHIRDNQLWGDIRRKATTHPALKIELERLIMFYQLIKTEKTNKLL